LPILWGHLNKVEGHFSLGERGFWAPLPMELSQMSPQIVRNKTPKDHWGHKWSHKNRIVSSRQNLFLQRGTQVHRHTGIVQRRSRP
jgi:hypothetical protein